MRTSLICVLISLFCGVVFAKPAVPVSMEWDKEVLRWRQSVRDTIKKSVETALAVVSSVPPKGDNFFSWEGDRRVLQNKEVVFYLASSSSSFVKHIFASKGQRVEQFNGDSLTAAVSDGKKNLKIIVVLLLDRLFYQPHFSNYDGVIMIDPHTERPDGFARTMIALAFEIYGNVQADLKSPLINGIPKVPDKNERMIGGYKASLGFIDRLQKSEGYKNLSPKIHKDFVEAKAREEKDLQRYTCGKNLSDLN